MVVGFRWVKRWWLNRKLRSLQADLHYMENYETLTAANGAPSSKKPDWMAMAIVRAKVQILQTQDALSGLG